MAPKSITSAKMLRGAKWVSVGIEFNPNWKGKQAQMKIDLSENENPKKISLGLFVELVVMYDYVLPMKMR